LKISLSLHFGRRTRRGAVDTEVKEESKMGCTLSKAGSSSVEAKTQTARKEIEGISFKRIRLGRQRKFMTSHLG
jgi:hypothetical protein